IGNHVDRGWSKRLGHGRVRGGARVLDHHCAAGLLDAARADGPVRAQTGEDHRYKFLSKDGSGATEEQVDGGPGVVGAVLVEAQAVTVKGNMTIRGDDVDDTVLQEFPISDGAH